MADEQEQGFGRRFLERLEQRVRPVGFKVVDRIDDVVGSAPTFDPTESAGG